MLMHNGRFVQENYFWCGNLLFPPARAGVFNPLAYKTAVKWLLMRPVFNNFSILINGNLQYSPSLCSLLLKETKLIKSCEI